MGLASRRVGFANLVTLPPTHAAFRFSVEAARCNHHIMEADYGLASVTCTPARFSPVASFFVGVASETSSSISDSAHTRSN